MLSRGSIWAVAFVLAASCGARDALAQGVFTLSSPDFKDGGRLVGVFAMTKPPRATIVTHSHDDFGHRALFDATVPVLPGLERLPAFVF